MPSSIIDFFYTIDAQSKTLCTTAKTRLAFVSAETKNIIRCPEIFIDAFLDLPILPKHPHLAQQPILLRW